MYEIFDVVPLTSLIKFFNILDNYIPKYIKSQSGFITNSHWITSHQQLK